MGNVPTVGASELLAFLDSLPHGDHKLALQMPANRAVPEFEGREDAVFCLWLFLEQLTNGKKNPRDFFQGRQKLIEEAGTSALLRLLSHSVAKDSDLDESTRDLLLAFLDDQLPSKLVVKRSRGKPARVPEGAIRVTMEEWLAGGGGLESAYAAVKDRLGVGRSRAQQVAKKHKLKPRGRH